MKLGRTLVCTLLSITVFMILGELTTRALVHYAIFYDVEMSKYATILKEPSNDPRIGHEHKANHEAKLMGVSVKINSDGMRDEEYAKARNQADRIVILGDSLTFGWGVEKEDMFESLIEERLNTVTPTEVINFGTGNYNTEQSVTLFEKKGLDYQPDSVFLFHFINDAETTPKKSQWGFLENSRFITLVWSRSRAIGAKFFPKNDFHPYYSKLYEEGAPGWEASKRAYLKLKRMCAKHGIDLKVFLLPELHQLEDYAFKKEHRKISDFLTKNKIESYDLAPYFSQTNLSPSDLWVAPDDAHPNARAHRMIADFVIKKLPAMPTKAETLAQYIS